MSLKNFDRLSQMIRIIFKLIRLEFFFWATIRQQNNWRDLNLNNKNIIFQILNYYKARMEKAHQQKLK